VGGRVEVEERRGATSREAGELNERLVELDVGLQAPKVSMPVPVKAVA
jgi:hypothetical protein